MVCTQCARTEVGVPQLVVTMLGRMEAFKPTTGTSAVITPTRRSLASPANHPDERLSSEDDRHASELASDRRYAGRDWTALEPEARPGWEAQQKGYVGGV